MKTIRQFSRAELRERIEDGYQCVSFLYCFSLLHTIHGESEVFVVNGWREKFRAGLVFTIGTALCGWWGLHGLYMTPVCLITNLCGGNDLTAAVRRTLESEALSRLVVKSDFSGVPEEQVAPPVDPIDFLRQLERDHQKQMPA